MKQKVTLKDIAKELNVSTTTVSKALKDYPDISKETKERVQKLVEEWNYTPNSMAVNLRNQRSGIIGVIIPEVVHYFFSEVISGIMKTAEEKGYMVLVFQSNEHIETEVKQCNLLRQYGVDGLLISLSNETNSNEHLKKLKDSNIHIVQFDKVDLEFNTSKVMIDDYQAAYQVTRHLIDCDRKTIAHIAGPIIPRNAKDRLKGYRDALIKNNYSYEQRLVYRTNDSTFEEGYNYAKKVLKEHSKLDAIFCVTDMLAIGAMAALKDAGKRIPEDVAVAGFSNWFMSSVVTPPLTTVDQPGDFIGQEATKILIEEIESKLSPNSPEIQHKKLIIPTEIVIRDSTIIP